MKEKARLYKGKDYATTAKDSSDPRLRKVVEAFSTRKFERVLDVGCGDGNFSLALKGASNAREVYGIEISPEGVELANKAGVKAFCLDIDEEDFPFADNFFDAVFCGEIIEHLYNPDHLLEEVRRTLKPKGLLVISTLNLAGWFNRIGLLFGFQPYGTNPSLKHVVGHMSNSPSDGIMVTSDHVRVFTLRSLKRLLRIYAFGIFRIIGVHENVPHEIPLSALLNIADRAFSLCPSLSYRVVICSEKR